MKYVVLGLQRSAGTFTSDDKREIEYDNTVMQCARRATGNGREDKVQGVMVQAVKVKSPQFAAFCKANGVAVSTDLLGGIVNVSYDQRGCVEEIDLVALAIDRKAGDQYADLPTV